MRTEIYLLRHGQTDWNRCGRMQGRSDVPLNETGRQQALKACQMLRAIHFDAVYSSPLRRAMETACLACGIGQEQLHVDKRLIEIGFGVLEGVEECQFPSDFFIAPHRYTPPKDGESFAQVLSRTGTFLADLLQTFRGRRVLAVSHGAALACLLLNVTHAPLEQLWTDFNMANCAVVAIADEGAGPFIAQPLAPEHTDQLRQQNLFFQ